VLLAATVLALAVASLSGSWRQMVILGRVAADDADTDAYQRAAYLTVRELGLLQGALREPSGEERVAAVDIGPEVLAALTALPLESTTDQRRVVTRQRASLQPAITQYFALLDSDEPMAAQAVLEERIEPTYEQLLQVLLREQEQRLTSYAADVARAERESRLAMVATILASLFGVAVLGIIGWWRRSQRQLLYRMAAQDPLTGLSNRTGFQSQTEVAIEQAKANEPPPTVLLLDLDGFKDVNDGLGHHTGDRLLIEVARRLRSSVRPNDTLARLDADEFAVLIAEADPDGGERAASRITQALDTAFVIDGLVLDIEASIGIATAEPGTGVNTLLRQADMAMYKAKEHRLGHCRYDPEQANDTANRLTMLGDLRRALDAGDQVTLHYQPKISLTTGDVIGAEALARWHHPTKGDIPPGTFSPILEGTNLIHRFTINVLDQALAQLRVWVDSGHAVPVAVNASTRCLLDATLPDTVAQALAKAGLPGSLLCIEITENTVMADPQRAIEVLRRIRALGVKTAIDDFGTGYSSMAYLRILPVDEIKVDRSFVRDMATDRSNYVLVESAIDLGHNFGLAVVAEGVENETTVEALRHLGCDIAQGYHYARPLAAGDFTAYLVQRLALGR
jgi:diguanylate cyclase (GGDEF)-like protein